MTKGCKESALPMSWLEKVSIPSGSLLAESTCVEGSIELTASKTSTDLCESTVLGVELAEGTCGIGQVSYYAKRASGGGEVLLGSGSPSFTWTTRVPGNFLVQGRTSNEQGNLVTAWTPINVLFPPATSVFSASIKETCLALWEPTLAGADYSHRIEKGLFVMFDSTGSGTYSTTDSGVEPADSGYGGENITQFMFSTQIQPPNGPGWNYHVGTFHTHSSMKFAPSNMTRKVGPSDHDTANDVFPTLLYDYKAHPREGDPPGTVYGGYDPLGGISSWSQFYGPVGPARRTNSSAEPAN